MSLFGRRKRFDIGNLGMAIGSLPSDYMAVWNERESATSSGLYSHRIVEIESAISEVRASATRSQALAAAGDVRLDPDEAARFVDDVWANRDATLRALVLLEAHKRTFPRALTSFQARRRISLDEFIETDEHEWTLHGACLAHLRQFVSIEVWGAFIAVTRTASHGVVVVPILENVRTTFPLEGELFRYPTWVPAP